MEEKVESLREGDQNNSIVMTLEQSGGIGEMLAISLK
jgi:hypothetical protein